MCQRSGSLRQRITFIFVRRACRQRRFSIMNTEPRQRLKSSTSIDTHQLLKTTPSSAAMVKIPALLVAKELSDIVIYTQAIKFRGENIVQTHTHPSLTELVHLIDATVSSSGLSASPSNAALAVRSVRKIPKRNIQQLVAQPSTTSTNPS